MAEQLFATVLASTVHEMKNSLSLLMSQLDEIGEAKVRATGGHDDGRILGSRAGPARRQAVGLACLVHVDDPVLRPEVPVVDQVILTPEQGMERVGDPETSALSLRIRCIRRRCPTESWKGPSNRFAGSYSITFASPLSSSFSGTWTSIARISPLSAVTKASMARPPRTVPTVLPLLRCSI